jgi:CubicO group peptidase (beta-lactamase class C family)
MRAIAIAAAVIPLCGCGQPAQQSVKPAAEAAVERIMANLRAKVAVRGRASPPTFSLSERMAHYQVPGISVAVADRHRIVWARGFGAKERGSTDSVTIATLFQAASISKPIAATATLRLVTEGTLSLDAPVNDYLVSWRVPENRFTTNEKVTLRRIVSHSAGLTVHGFPGYAAGVQIPSVIEILDGKGTANTAPVRLDTIPGSVWRYSGGGVTIQQVLLTDVTSEAFSALMKRLVLEPIGMTSSTFEQPLPETLRGTAASGHRSDGSVIAGRWHTYPEMAAAGLWTTPTDLVTWAIEIAAARAGRATTMLSKLIATEMLTFQKGTSGLGPTLAGTGAGFNFGHGGANAGFRSRLIYFPETGQGAAVMANSDGGDSLIREVLLSIGAEYDWPGYAEIEPLEADSAAIARYVGEYVIARPYSTRLSVKQEGKQLFKEAASLLGPREEIVLTAPGRAIGVQSGIVYSFAATIGNRIDRLELLGLTLVKQ